MRKLQLELKKMQELNLTTEEEVNIPQHFVHQAFGFLSSLHARDDSVSLQSDCKKCLKEVLGQLPHIVSGVDKFF
jgi:hypothetical protein